MLDCKVIGADVVDGTGDPRRRADIGIRDGRVVGIGALDEDASHTIDAGGLVAAPGFVDIHTHYDAQAFWDPALTPSPLHGVTTIVGGNCGFTIAPLEPSEADYLMRMLARVEGMPLESLEAGVPWDWRTFGEYLDRLDGTLAVNAGFLVGHSAIRRAVMGAAGTGEEASPEQLDAMAALLSDSLAAGGLGFSSSQAPTHNDGDGNPVPSRAATPAELVTLARVVRDHPGTTLEFIPAVGAFAPEHVELMTDMSLAANRPLNWNVLGVNSARPDGHETLLAASDEAAARGARVLALTVPDVMRIHLSFKSGFLLDALPGWGATMALPPDEKMRALADPGERKRLKDAAASPEAGVIGGLARWERMTIVDTFDPGNKGLAGRNVGDVAAERGQDPFDALVDIVLADELRTVVMPPAAGDDDESWKLRVNVWRDHRAVVGASDAGAHLDMLSTFNYSTAMLHEAVVKRGLLPLEEAIHLITDVQARLYGIRDRGRIAEGWHADLVVFDETRIGPGPVHTRHDLPGGAGRLYAEAEGIEHVLVNGTEIVTGGELTGERPGTLLRSGRDTETVEVPGAGVTDLAGIETGAPALEPDLARPLPRAVRALAFRDFRLFWSASIGSNIGTNMQLAALAWVVAVETRSAAKVTLIAFVTVFPMLALGPVGGALADRLPRRALLLVTQSALMIQAFALWGVWVTGNASYWTLFAISVTGGLIIAANTPAWQAFVVDLVPRDYLQNAITLNSTQFNVARAAGPMIAGLLIAHVGAGICFLINALSFLFVLVALLAMSPATRGGAADPEARPGVIAAFMTGLRYLQSQPGMRVAIGTHAVFALLGAPVVQLIPVLSVEVLDVGSEAYGLLLGSFGIGAVAVALVIGTIDEHVVRSRILAAGMMLAAASVIGLGATSTVVVGVLFMVVFGAAYVTVTAMVNSSLQSLTDDRVRGRITSLWLMTFGLFFPLGTILQGVIADIVGVRAVLVVSGAIIAAALAWTLARRRLPLIDTPKAAAPP